MSEDLTLGHVEFHNALLWWGLEPYQFSVVQREKVPVAASVRPLIRNFGVA